MNDHSLSGKLILVTGAARRIGRIFALACAHAGADIIIHHGHSDKQAWDLKQEINDLGNRAEIVRADMGDPQQVIPLMARVSSFGRLYALVNSAAIFERISLEETTLTQWDHHLAINLTAPFLLSQAFAKQVQEESSGHIINILDWRATRPETDHFPYTISKVALAALTKSLALALAPTISVNGLALGSILPSEDQTTNPEILKKVPAGRWGDSAEISKALLFLLTEPTYVTGEILHVDGGRHLL